MNLQRTDNSPNENAERVRNHFAQHSSAWGNRYGALPCSMADLDLALRRECVHRLLWPILNDAGRKLRVIDVGCGTGDVLDGLPRDLMQVTGVDFVREMALVAGQSHPADRFMTADATALPFRDNSADVVTSLGMFEYLAKPADALRSIHHTLKPGGCLIASFPNRFSVFRKFLAFERAVERLIHGLRSRGTNPAVEALQTTEYEHKQWTVSQARQMLRAAGFDVENVLMHTMGPWGRLGRWKPVLRLSRFTSRLMMNNRVLSPWFASTMVIRARKQATTGKGRRC